jgi:uncharacterized damage-inducible protein DinB
MTTTETTEKPVLSAEKADLLEALAQHRFFIRYTVRDLTDEQARARTTASELCLGGLIKHVTHGERIWTNFILEGPSAIGDITELTEEVQAGWTRRFRMEEGETLAGLLEDYAEAARRTDEVVAALPDLDITHPLPLAPWFEPGTRRSARRVLLHIMAETAQHAGHADIIRESLDGAKTMG